MSSENNTIDQEPSQATTETFRPLVDLVLDQLMAKQRGKEKSPSVDDKTKDVLIRICVDMVYEVSRVILKEFKNCLAQRKNKTPPESPEMISEEEVQKYLGNSISDAFLAVTGSPVPRKSAKRLKDMVAKKITERINSQRTSTLHIMVGPMGSMLSCKEEISYVSTSHTVDSQSPDIVESSPAEQEEEWEETPISLFGTEDHYAVGSFIDMTSEAVKQILLDHVSDPEVKSNADISEEEYLQIVRSIQEDTGESACEIAHYIWSNREEFGLSDDGTPSPDAQFSRLNCWNIVANKIKTLFARKFAKEAIASFIVKLRTELNCKKAPLDVLIPAADKVVQDMIPEDPDECTYKTMAICISSGQHEVHSKQLGQIISEHLQRHLGARKVNQLTVQMEVDKFMKTMRNWLNRQSQKLTQKNNRVDDSLKRIRGVLELPELPEDTMTPEESAAPSTTDESGVSDDEDITTTPVTELRSPYITDEPGDEDISITPVSELRSQSITDEPGVSDEFYSVTPVSLSVDDEDDENDENLSPELDSLTPQVTYEPALSDITQPSDPAEQFCVAIAAAVVHQCLKKTQISTSNDEKKMMVSILKHMLCTGGVDVESIQLTGQQIKKTARAVHKDLCAIMGSKGFVLMNLLSEDLLIYECVFETLKRQLEKPKKTGIKGFFTSLLNTVTKPFKA